VADLTAPEGFRAAVALTGAEPFTVAVESWPGAAAAMVS
jgi:hypothetical protein